MPSIRAVARTCAVQVHNDVMNHAVERKRVVSHARRLRVVLAGEVGRYFVWGLSATEY